MKAGARQSLALAALACAALGLPLDAEAAPAELNSVRVWSLGNVTRIAVQTSGEIRWRRDQLSQPPRLFVDLHDCVIRLDPGQSRVMQLDDPLIDKIRIGLNQPRVVRIVFDLKSEVDFEMSQLANPFRLMIEIRPKGPESPALVSEASKTTSERFEARAEAIPPAPAPAAPAPASAEPKKGVAQTPPPAPEPPVNVQEKPVESAKTRSERAANKPPATTPRQTLPNEPKTRMEALRNEPKTAPAEPLRNEPKAAAEPVPNEPKAAPGPAVRNEPENRQPERIVELAEAPKPADSDSRGRRSLTRALGLKLTKVAIDPGHGGHDHGTTGPGGVIEKELVLDLSKRLGKLIEERLGAEVVYTRQTDVFVPLEERTAIANQQRADLFLSIHVNSSPLRSASGPEVFYLSFTDSKADLAVAARENAGHGKSIFELTELIQKIALKDKVEESSEFARRVQNSLHKFNVKTTSNTKNRGVKKAPFVVLIGASMPSVLAEVGFVTNPREESLLKKGDYRDRLVEALYQGVADYAATLSKMTVAQDSAAAKSSSLKR